MSFVQRPTPYLVADSTPHVVSDPSIGTDARGADGKSDAQGRSPAASLTTAEAASRIVASAPGASSPENFIENIAFAVTEHSGGHRRDKRPSPARPESQVATASLSRPWKKGSHLSHATSTAARAATPAACRPHSANAATHGSRSAHLSDSGRGGALLPSAFRAAK